MPAKRVGAAHLVVKADIRARDICYRKEREIGQSL